MLKDFHSYETMLEQSDEILREMNEGYIQFDKDCNEAREQKRELYNLNKNRG